jgi:hypothetical protein
MDKSPESSPETAAAAAEVAEQFRSLVSAEDVGSIKQAQHLM